ncbi:hypothetical protein [Sagittula sp. S175]|uniref:hypothetical protein n=1 Tax=Sagittula sp. S175 TaxID=3415129 RepID=UPI003C7B0561
MDDRHSHIASIALLGLTLVVAMGFSLALTASALPPRAGQPVMVIAWPWGTAAEHVVRATGGAPISPWQPRHMAALAMFSGDIPLDELHRLGVWAVLDGKRVAEICGVP